MTGRLTAAALATTLMCLLSGATCHAEAGKKPGGPTQKPQWEQDYPEPAPPANRENWGRHLQRTMSLLASSTPHDHNQVRILFYGQSIVASKKWTDAVVADLKTRFPHADIVYENRAIGGFSSQYLVHAAEADVFPFHPDLIVFHVYGAHNDYQRLIHKFRSRTTAEVAIVTDHLGSKEFDGEKVIDPGDWKTFMRETMVPKVAQAYDAQLIDITAPWIRYLTAHQLPSQALLKDGVHPNDHGCFLMSRLVARELVHRPDLPVSRQSSEMVRSLRVGEDVRFDGGKLTLPFDGNRVDLLPASNPGSGEFRVSIDGRAPSSISGCYTHSRTSRCPGVAWPALLHVQWNTVPLIENWTLTVQEVREPNSDFSFEVVGSKTGFDGKGNSTETFVSESGRVVIPPRMWMNMERDYKFKKVPLEPGFEVKWSIRPMFVESYNPPAEIDPTRENNVVLVQGLQPGEHTLELEWLGEGEPPVRELRTHQPPVDRPLDLVANPPR